MKNIKTKIKFTDIAGMLERDQMKEIIGGSGTAGSGAYIGGAPVSNGGYVNPSQITSTSNDSEYLSFMNSAGFIPMMGQGGQAGLFGANPSNPTASNASNANTYVFNNSFIQDYNKPKTIQIGATTITDPVQISQIMANLANQYNSSGHYDLTDPNLTIVSGKGYYYDPKIKYNVSIPGMISGQLGELTLFTFKTPVALSAANPFKNQLYYNPYDGNFSSYFSGEVSNNSLTSYSSTPIHGSFSKPSVLEAAIMSKAVYGDPLSLQDSADLHGWKVSTAVAGLMLNDPASGFKSQLFERTNKTTGLTEFCYVTAGTDFSSAKDWMANGLQLLGLSKQYDESTNNAMVLKELLGDALSFAGHSLGGGLAEANAIATGDSAITFNAAGVSIFTNGCNFKSDTDAYIMSTDPLNSVQHSNMLLPTAGGNIHTLNPVSPSGWLNGHSINSVIESLRPH